MRPAPTTFTPFWAWRYLTAHGVAPLCREHWELVWHIGVDGTRPREFAWAVARFGRDADEGTFMFDQVIRNVAEGRKKQTALRVLAKYARRGWARPAPPSTRGQG